MQLTRNSRKKNRLDITPLIDVVFLLLIFFLLTFAVQGQGIDIQLPGSGSGSVNDRAPLTLVVNQDGSLGLDAKPVGFDSIVQELENKFADRNDRSLVVDVHKTVEYDVFVRVLDLAKKAGAENFSIIR